MEYIIGKEYEKKIGGFSLNNDKVILEEIDKNSFLIKCRYKKTGEEFLTHKDCIREIGV
jgi:hypothetical protein